MDSIYLRTLVEVARTGSMTKAADALAVTHSAVSRRIRFMEEQYGRPLLDRSGPALALTAAGAVVVEKAQRILEIEGELMAALRVKGGRGPALSVACTPTFGAVHLPGILRDFMLAQADVGDLKLVLEMPEKIAAGLEGGSYDMAVLEHCDCIDLSRFDTVSLASDELVFAVSPSLGVEEPHAVLDLLLSQTLYTRSEGCCLPMILRGNLERLGRTMADFKRIVVYDDLREIVRSVMDGEGVAFVSSEVLHPYVEAGQLRACRVPGFRHGRRRTLVDAGGARESVAAAFVHHVLRRVGAARPGEPAGC